MPPFGRKSHSTVSARSDPYSVSSLLRKSIESLKYVIGMPKFASPETNEPENHGRVAVDENPAVISEGVAPAASPQAHSEAPKIAIAAHSAENLPVDSNIYAHTASGRPSVTASSFAHLATPSEPLKPQPVRSAQPVSRRPLLPLEVAKVVSRMGAPKPSLPKLSFNCERATYFVEMEESAFGKFINTRKTHGKKLATAPESVAGSSFAHVPSKTPAKSDPLEYALRQGTPQPSVHSVGHLDFSHSATPFVASATSMVPSQAYGRTPNPPVSSAPASPPISRKRTHEDKSLLDDVLSSSVTRLHKRQARDFAPSEDKQKINRMFNALQTLNPASLENASKSSVFAAGDSASASASAPLPNFKKGDLVFYDRAPTKCAKVTAVFESEGAYEISYDGIDGKHFQKNVTQEDISSLETHATSSRLPVSSQSSVAFHQTPAPKATNQLNPFMGRGAQNPTPSKKSATPQNKVTAINPPSDSVATRQQANLFRSPETPKASSQHFPLISQESSSAVAPNPFAAPSAPSAAASAAAPVPASTFQFGSAVPAVPAPLAVAAVFEQPTSAAPAVPSTSSSSSAAFVFGGAPSSAAVASNPFAAPSAPSAAASAAAPVPASTFQFGAAAPAFGASSVAVFPSAPVSAVLSSAVPTTKVDFSSFASNPVGVQSAAADNSAKVAPLGVSSSSLPTFGGGSNPALSEFGGVTNPVPSFPSGGSSSFVAGGNANMSFGGGSNPTPSIAGGSNPTLSFGAPSTLSFGGGNAPVFGGGSNPTPSYGGASSFGGVTTTPSFGVAGAAPSSSFSAGNTGFGFGGAITPQQPQQDADEGGPQQSILKKTLK